MTALNAMERARLQQGWVGVVRAQELGGPSTHGSCIIISVNLGITMLDQFNVLEPWGSQQEVSLKHV